MATPDQIAAELLEHLEATEYSVTLQASKPEKPRLKVDDPGVRVQVIPRAGGGRQKTGRRAVRRTHDVNLYVTAELGPRRTRGQMLELVDEVLASLDFVDLGGATWSETEEISLFDNQAIVDADRFASLHRVRYVEEYLV